MADTFQEEKERLVAIQVRVPEDGIARIDNLRRAASDLPSRAEIVRRIIESVVFPQQPAAAAPQKTDWD